MACPAFATEPTGIPASNGAAYHSPANDCIESVLGVSSGSVSLQADWSANISGAITLDAKRYTSASDTQGTASSPNVSPTTVYSKYADGLYSDSTAETKVNSLTTAPEQTGYTFGGFYTSKYTGGTQVIDENGDVLPAAATQITSTGTTGTYYAQWSANQYSVTYNKGDGAGNNYTHTNGATYDQNYTIPSGNGTEGTGVAGASTPQTGYTFIGWTTDSTPDVTRTSSATATNAGTVANAWTGETPWTRTEDLTVYAGYLANQYTVSYLCTGGEPNSVPSGTTASGTVSNQIVTYDDSYTLNNGSGCTLTGYTFNGWSCTNNLSGALSNGDPASGTWSITNDSTCTAQWTVNSIALSWDANGADNGGTGGGGTCSYDSAITLPTNPTKTGYTFKGWKVKTGFDLTTITGTNLTDDGIAHGCMSHNGVVNDNTSAYGLTEPGTWGVTLADSSTKVRGTALCSTDGSGLSMGATGTPNESGTDLYCWCKVTGYQASGSSEWQDVVSGNSSTPWIFLDGMGSSTGCEYDCADVCAGQFQNNFELRRFLFGM